MSFLFAWMFCGFYVNGAGSEMFNDATEVVLMRQGTRTVLSMQNDYRGPLEDFAMVVPVPVVLKEGDVKVIPKSVFDRVDSLGSPRLVEYWEQDPCPPPEPEYSRNKRYSGPRPSVAMKSPSAGMSRDDSVDYAPAPREEAARRVVPPQLASFEVSPPAITANTPQQLTWSYQYANSPWPEPVCTVDHGVGRVSAGQTTTVNIPESTNFKLTCANSGGKATKEF